LQRGRALDCLCSAAVLGAIGHELPLTWSTQFAFERPSRHPVKCFEADIGEPAPMRILDATSIYVVKRTPPNKCAVNLLIHLAQSWLSALRPVSTDTGGSTASAVGVAALM
jgi:hypothetical protein